MFELIHVRGNIIKLHICQRVNGLLLIIRHRYSLYKKDLLTGPVKLHFCQLVHSRVQILSADLNKVSPE